MCGVCLRWLENDNVKEILCDQRIEIYGSADWFISSQLQINKTTVKIEIAIQE